MRAALLVTLLATAFAAPAHLSVLDAPVSSLGPGRHELAPRDVREIGRLARSVNAASCPQSLQSTTAQTSFGGEERSNVLLSSSDAKGPEMSWYIWHTPTSGLLSVSFSSVRASETATFLSALSDDSILPPLLPLPTYLFPALGSIRPLPLVHTAFLPALETHGASAIAGVLDILEREGVITKIEITGHGLGAATALLVATALRQASATPPVEATLFSLPRVGDRVFPQHLDSLTSASFTLRRVTSHADATVHLPSRDMGLVHPRAAREVFIDSRRQAAVCVPANDESSQCAAGVAERRVQDAAGPYAGVWIGEC